MQSNTHINKKTTKHEHCCERVPKRRHTRCQNKAKVNAKVGIERIMNIMKFMFFLMCKNRQIHCNKNVFEGFTSCVRERTMYQTKTSRMRSKSILKSIQHRCGNDAQKNDAKMMENGANMGGKREPTLRKRFPK